MFAATKMLATLSTAALLIAGASAASAAMPREAASPTPSSVEVRFGDLDLTSQSGQRTLERRIARAATFACTSFDGQTNKNCRAASIERAKAPVAAAIARAASSERYADAGSMTVRVGK